MRHFQQDLSYGRNDSSIFQPGKNGQARSSLSFNDSQSSIQIQREDVDQAPPIAAYGSQAKLTISHGEDESIFPELVAQQRDRVNSQAQFDMPLKQNKKFTSKHDLKKYDSLINLVKPSPAIAASFKNILTREKTQESNQSSLEQLRLSFQQNSKKEGRLYSHQTLTQTGRTSPNKGIDKSDRKSSLISLKKPQSIRSRTKNLNITTSNQPRVTIETQKSIDYGEMLLSSIDEVQIMPNISKQ